MGLDPTVSFKNVPSVPLMENTGMCDGALTAPALKIRRARPPPASQLAAIWAKSVGPGVCLESTRQIFPFAADGTSVGNAAPSGT